MRSTVARVWWLLSLGLLVQTAHAQQRSAPGADLSGVYVAVYVGEPVTVIEPDIFPMTPSAQQMYDAFDPLVSDPRRIDDCAPETMPTILWSANPMEVVQLDDRVEMRFEENNTTRVIPLEADPPTPGQPHTPLGYSIGRWEGDVLIVETSHLSSPLIKNDLGYPLSRGARINERFWRDPGDNSLQMELTIYDSTNYLDTLRFTREWAWSESDHVQPWECFSLGSREGDEPPDLDALTRMLEER